MLKNALFTILIFLFGATFVLAQQTFPKYDGYVNDYENILNNDDELEAVLTEFEKNTTVEIAIVTVPDFGETTIEDYAVKLFENWGIGKADVDNGLLIIVSSTQRKSRFEVGYGLEGSLNDSRTGSIQDVYMIPQFQKGDYSKGVKDGVLATIAVLQNDPTVISSLEDKSDSGSASVAEIIVMFLFFGFYIMAATKSWWLGGLMGFIVGGYFAYTTNQYYLPLITTPIGLLIDYILSHSPLGRALLHASMNGIRSGGGSSGGGISFGGGSSGGGGSSRSW